MRRLIIGDVHGSYRALMEVLEKASFSSDDQLYFTGDAADGYMDVYECLSFFMELGERFHPVIGNHDVWLQNWLLMDEAPYEWVSQGGRASILSFERACVSPSRRREIGEFLLSWPYVISTEHEYICHGGPGDFASDDDMERLAALKRNPGYGCSLGEKIMWDRSYYVYADYDEKHDRSVKRFGKLSCSKRLFIGILRLGHMNHLSVKGTILSISTPELDGLVVSLLWIWTRLNTGRVGNRRTCIVKCVNIES